MLHADKIYRVIKNNPDLEHFNLGIDNHRETLLHESYNLNNGFVRTSDIHIDDLVQAGYAVLETPMWAYFCHDDDGWREVLLPDIDEPYSDEAVATQVARAKAMFDSEPNKPSIHQAGVMCGTHEMFNMSDSNRGLAYFEHFCFRTW